jgi:hypothetical protein
MRLFKHALSFVFRVLFDGLVESSSSLVGRQ